VVAGLLLVGLEQMTRDLDTYTADLTRGHGGDFPASAMPGFATTYQSDGYHLLITEPGTFAPTGVKSATSHTALAVEIAVTPLAVPSGAAFGPFCWEDPTHGYGLLIDGSGSPQLVQLMNPSAAEIPAPADLEVLATGRPTSATPGHSHRLMLTCSTTGLPAVRLRGYVDDTKVLETSAASPASEFRYTGIAGRTGDAAPAEWSVTRFWRKGPADMPTG